MAQEKGFWPRMGLREQHRFWRVDGQRVTSLRRNIIEFNTSQPLSFEDAEANLPEARLAQELQPIIQKAKDIGTLIGEEIDKGQWYIDGHLKIAKKVLETGVWVGRKVQKVVAFVGKKVVEVASKAASKWDKWRLQRMEQVPLATYTPNGILPHPILKLRGVWNRAVLSRTLKRNLRDVLPKKNWVVGHLEKNKLTRPVGRLLSKTGSFISESWMGKIARGAKYGTEGLLVLLNLNPVPVPNFWVKVPESAFGFLPDHLGHLASLVSFPTINTLAGVPLNALTSIAAVRRSIPRAILYAGLTVADAFGVGYLLPITNAYMLNKVLQLGDERRDVYRQGIINSVLQDTQNNPDQALLMAKIVGRRIRQQEDKRIVSVAQILDEQVVALQEQYQASQQKFEELNQKIATESMRLDQLGKEKGLGARSKKAWTFVKKFWYLSNQLGEIHTMQKIIHQQQSHLPQVAKAVRLAHEVREDLAATM